ncbi:MAG: GNAT family N-acetyltransferase [Geminicoccaceae bacterium]
MSPDLPLLAQLQGQLRRALLAGSEVVDTATFRLHVWPHGDLFYRNIAVPRRRPADWDPAIGELLDRLAELGRSPRLEFIEELWPDLPAALEVAGLRCEMRAPVMVLDVIRTPPGPSAPAVRLAPDLPDESLARFIARGEAVFGMSPRAIPTRELDELRRDLATGRTIATVVRAGEDPVAAASLAGCDREAELAGVWTAPAHRRQGLATACCRLAIAAFARSGGALVWLSAPEPDGERLYRQLGFVPVGTQLNYAW